MAEVQLVFPRSTALHPKTYPGLAKSSPADRRPLGQREILAFKRLLPFCSLGCQHKVKVANRGNYTREGSKGSQIRSNPAGVPPLPNCS